MVMDGWNTNRLTVVRMNLVLNMNTLEMKTNWKMYAAQSKSGKYYNGGVLENKIYNILRWWFLPNFSEKFHKLTISLCGAFMFTRQDLFQSFWSLWDRTFCLRNLKILRGTFHFPLSVSCSLLMQEYYLFVNVSNALHVKHAYFFACKFFDTMIQCQKKLVLLCVIHVNRQ